MKNTRNYALDILKAASIVLVFLLHTRPFKLSVVNTSNSLFLIPVHLTSFLYDYITVLAVPTFFIVSLTLFYDHYSARTNYIFKRVKRLFNIFIFWAAIQTSIYFLVKFILTHLHVDINMPQQSIMKSIVLGGPALPVVGDSVFYFLFNLILMTIIFFFFLKINIRHKDILYIALVLLLIVFTEVRNLYERVVPYWRLDNFLIYIPASYLLAKKDSLIRLKYYYLLLFLIFCVHDIILRDFMHFKSTTYARNSVFFGVIALYSVVQSINFKERSKISSLLSKYSLGLFALHKYWLLFFLLLSKALFSSFEIPLYLIVYNIKIHLSYLGIGIAVFAFTVLSVYVLCQTGLSKYVS